ncbi:MAG: AAA family ATPase [bacterium]
MNNGFIIKKLRVTGPGLPNAEVAFSKGLNVISGASNTGKSYVFECINFLLGTAKKPRNAKRSTGYTSAFLEIEKSDGTFITLKRRLNGGNFSLYNCKIDDITSNIEPKILLADNIQGRKDTISYFLLSLIEFNDKLIKKNMQGETLNFSYRDIAHLTLIDETRITTENSPVFSGQYTLKTKEINILRLLLTGLDDSDIEKIEKPAIYKSKIQAKIELIENLIGEIESQITENNNLIHNLDADINQINNKINQLTAKISSDSKLISEYITRKNSLIKQSQLISDKKLTVESLLAKFNLLKQHYVVDLDRLEFIIEGDILLSQFEDIDCPVCGNLFDESKFALIESNKTYKTEEIQKACVVERDKIKYQMKDLDNTTSPMLSYLKETNSTFEDIQRQINEIESYIEKELKPVFSVEQKELQRCIEYKKIYDSLELKELSLKDLTTRRKELNDKLLEKIPANISNKEIESNLYYDLCIEIIALLKDWKYPNTETVHFDPVINDIIISGEERNAFGKGHRSVLFSAFIIGLMLYTKKKKLKYSNIVVLDSPLTAYKGSEKAEQNDELSLELESAFFEGLSKYKEKQIIILDNKEPSATTKDKINYIKFTGNKNIGREGFFEN